MPELPEVETVMRGMLAALQNRTIRDVIVRRHDLRWRIPADFSQQVVGRRIEGFCRRGKYILIRLSGGRTIILHLGMSGRIALDSPQITPPHEHVVLSMDDAGRCAYIDPRRFGMLTVIPTQDEERFALLAGMGPEPLSADFTPRTLLDAFSGRRTPIKTALLDQKVVAGLGNIYVSEALYRAGIHPQMLAAKLTGPQARKLVKAIRAVLEEAIAAGGSSLKDYVRPGGELGYFQHAWQVYNKKGKPCPRCPGPPQCHGVEQITQAGRSSFFCPRFQKNG
ncbi:bifunctional DNA-formamidopyrimidine glycosylase/DNA-(apurinic or apyrimidinic site) lyase [Acetobacter sp. TBRC 12305]|uniref:Formamidopyrimidine-DNA glycosylase n=1 Tax=Acetobacter garciniae TaxID=2817435 RepID=A0A939KPQ3_9PROT|nr:bifunctional DNA-formamidopyrimidine glycosylase/DNA-(apurinic or apyrimidinic site) lyase [Acetobacter garciniae]MBO1324222.1 bifunctional DNA-formamidopyrimidine glycosylase/DNA-(apurinic or apyrimidinic site) lyase [Acetobacter garciniae]MBX0343911.1 bifunctional DNA-formamidopyrimidine glycosylase/DNA-(apurinic or apyrimidinic site) lyase [Acetobacter garciniae]